MCGKRVPQGTMLVLVNLEERVPKDHPLRTIKEGCGQSLGASLRGVRRDVLGHGPGVGATPERPLKASFVHLSLLRAQRADILRGAAIQPAVSLVLGYRPDGKQLRTHSVKQEPQAPAGVQDSPGAVNLQRRVGLGSGHISGSHQQQVIRQIEWRDDIHHP